MSWKPVTEPPELVAGDWGEFSSEPVLVFTNSESMKVATCEHWPTDKHWPVDKPCWMTTCSECLDITNDVLFWQPLPEPPAGENS